MADVASLLKQRPFAYSEVFVHPPTDGPAFSAHGGAREGLDPAVAAVCKNESNCTVFFGDGTWLTTWSQGSFEHALDEQIVSATSGDTGRTWTTPRPIIGSNPDERIAYGAPFIVPGSERVVLFFFAGNQRVGWSGPDYDSGNFWFVVSDDRGQTWSERRMIALPDRDISTFTGRCHGWINHPPRVMPTGEVLLPVSMYPSTWPKRARAWMTIPAEVSVVRCDNVLTEEDPDRLHFTLLPEGPRGIRADVRKHWDNPALQRLLGAFDGVPYETAFNFQEMTLLALSDGRWVGVGRTFLGAPGYTVSEDRGQSWSAVEPLCYAPGGPPIMHPMTMCPVTQTSDGRVVLLFTNNDGTQRGARHVWDGDGHTRNPQWLAVGRETPGEQRNAGLRFGEPFLVAEVDDTGETNLKTGISMPQFLEREGRYFVVYNINKEHLLLDEIPAAVLAAAEPS
ncbi:glycoside hydrolase [bacterium]|nr:glycoside hydrolase [bacterium]